MKEDRELTKACYGVVSGGVASVLALAYWAFALKIKPDSIFGVGYLGNIKCYILLVGIFLTMFCICYGIMRICNLKIISNVYLNSIVGVVFLVLIATAVTPFLRDTWCFSGLTTIVIGGGWILLCMKSIRDEKSDESKFNSMILILIGGILWGIAVATSNTFSPAAISATYDVHHTSAYIDSIYNVYKHTEFHGGITDQYGHYGLFFYLPLKIFGFSTKTIAGVCGVLSGATYIFAMSSFCRIVKSNVLRYLVIIVGGMYAIYPAIGSIYWQLYPHRVLFPAITIFLSTVFLRSEVNVWKKCGAISVMTLAVIWNLETGVICCLAWAAFRGLDVLQNEAISIKSTAKIIGRVVCVVMIPLIGAYSIVNLYNLSCGGVEAWLGAKEFAGMVVDNGYITSLSTLLEWGNMTYLHKVMVFMVCLCWGAIHNRLFGKAGMREKAGYAIVNGIIGLGLMTYYVNRTLAGDHLVNLFFVICLGLILDGMALIIRNRKKIQTFHLYDVIKYIAGLYALVVLLGCSLQSLGLYSGYVNKYNTNAYSYDHFSAFAEQIAEIVPKNTWAMGDGMSALYMELEWEKGTWGFGDTQADEIPKQDAIFVSNIRYDVVPENFKLLQEFIYYDIAFGYFVKEE